MIPPFNLSGVLPPFLGLNPAEPNSQSPYKTTLLEFAQRFCTSAERVTVIKGLIGYRQALRSAGIVLAFQWLDGSFCEDIEKLRGRAPSDIDMITLLVRPVAHSTDPAWSAWVAANRALFDRAYVKSMYRCDAFPVDIGLPASLVLSQITYWFGLFTHQRVTSLWKGILLVDLGADDNDALTYANSFTFAPGP